MSIHLNKTILHLINFGDFDKGNSLNSYKKKAIETGISLAKGNLIVTTDADCIVQPSWLTTIASFYEDTGSVFIAAPVVVCRSCHQMIHRLKNFLRYFSRLILWSLQGITGASVYKKLHNMCNGANLAYEKNAFHEVDGFEGIDNIASGDDMLLMHKIEKKYPGKIGYIKSANVIVQTQPSENIKEFINQRIRWASKADRYPDIKITSVLFVVYFLNAWIFFMASLFLLLPESFLFIAGFICGENNYRTVIPFSCRQIFWKAKITLVVYPFPAISCYLYIGCGMVG